MIKIGRNDLCPCGSGKKYKKCCIGKESGAAVPALSLVEPSAGTTVRGTIVQPPSENQAVSGEKPASKGNKLTLPKLRRLVSRELQWESPAHEQLGLTLIEQMRYEYDKELIAEALMLWNGFSRMAKPVVKKEGAFCAAIEYLLSEEYGFMLTQADLAGKYEITKSTLARRYKELCAYVDEYAAGGTEEMLPPEVLIGSLKGSAKEKAAELVFRAMDSASPKSRSQLAKAALELDPDNTGAYLLLADEAEGEQEARALLKAGMEAGRRELGSAFFAENKGHFWLIPETRPYIRLCTSYAGSCWFGGAADEAAGVLEHILELNPNDNTGARYLLLAVYLYTDRLTEAEKLLKAYGEEDGAASFAYDRMVLEFKRHGVTSRLKMLYRVAKGVNKHVPDYLLGAKMLPHNLPDYIGRGDANEAIEYVIMHSRLWTSVPELLKWMLKQ
ncbi:tetratricopeptide (TPR) repeat protein [Paenibacillus forsythiae]|uniref:Tetratricopeptide (TPR) repeat protein n=1 Tax=Paenibacillus forsythiae TaxID=365616 RepID=A0ABU3HBI6_9BACL|nr:SEC-C metal-binding domain-containing protein [Paenibacillus forsythiae]MDT3427816.1 tetratricopeptide (TPR) repeat protein [Paenibacillus forsythiae]